MRQEIKRILTGYELPDGRVLFVSAGLGGKTFGTFWQKSAGALRRFKSTKMPMVDSEIEAMKNLVQYAQEQQLPAVTLAEVGK